ncbi:efflux RND transporter permease subunit [Rhodobacteraceae bacterium NNCM2]|nr:efflux RND transporter permease subunit [Coraliihabitans acroporae]
MTSRLRPGGPVAWMARHSVAPNLVMLLLIVGGLFMSTQIKQEYLPASDPDIVTVTVVLPGATPEEVEQSIVLALESELRDVTGIDELSAAANEGSASVTLELSGERSREQVYADVVQAVGRITTFPDDAEEPQIALAARKREVVELHLVGDVDPMSLRMAAERVRTQLLQHPDISQVELAETNEMEIHIEVPRSALLAYSTSLEEVAEKVRRASLDRSGGTLETRGGDLLLRMSERREALKEFAMIPVIADRRGTVVRLGDIAELRQGFADDGSSSTFDGKPSIRINVYRVGDETPIKVSEAVRGKPPPTRMEQAWIDTKRMLFGIEPKVERPTGLDTIMATLPEALEVVVLNDRSVNFKERMQLLLKNGFFGLLLVLVVLSLFLEFKLAFWVAVGIPTAFLGTLLFMPWFGFSINMVSMFAFILALGIVVDDAIVAGENIYEYLERGMSRIDAAIHGARDIAVPLSFSILTNIVAFIPLALVPGTFGQFWIVIPFVVSIAFMLSWVEALFVLPAHLAAVKRRKEGDSGGPLIWIQKKFSGGLNRFIESVYAPLLRVSMRWRYATVALMIAILLIVMAFPLSGRMGWGLFPQIPRDFSAAKIFMPVDASFETKKIVRDRAASAAARVVAANGGDQLSQGIYTNIENDRILIEVHLQPDGIRPITTAKFTELWRAEAGSAPEARFSSFESSFGGPGSSNGIEIKLSHPDVDVLATAAGQLAAELAAFGPVRDPNDGFTPGKEQLEFRLTEAAHSLDLSPEMVGGQVRAAFFGVEALAQQDGRNEVTVRVRLPIDERRSEGAIEQLLIRTPDTGDVPLFEIATVERSRASANITREDGLRRVTVTANVDPPDEVNQVLSAVTGEVLPRMTDDYPGLSYELGGRQATQKETLDSFVYFTIPLALVIIYGLLAIPFRSYVQPAIVMTAIPFGAAGAVIGHMIMDMSLSIISIFGIIALGGVVINAALVMIDYANKTVTAGASPFEAMWRAGQRRFRPILLTTLTTFGGLAPMIFETSRQAQFLIPMAVSLGYGILFSTAIVLFLIPCLYLILDDIRWLINPPSPESPAKERPVVDAPSLAAE